MLYHHLAKSGGHRCTSRDIMFSLSRDQAKPRD